MTRVRILPIVLAVLAMASCGRGQEPYHRTIYTFGTLAGISIYDLPRDQAAAAADSIELRLAELNRDWYAWGTGELGALNERLAASNHAPVSPKLARLLKRSFEIRKLSGGRFDPTVGSLVELWGFHEDSERTRVSPAPDAIESDLKALGFNVRLAGDDSEIRTGGVGVVVDLGGIAKGAALAELRDLLRDLGIARAMIDIGGDVVAVDRDNSEPFRVGVRDPRNPSILGVADVRDGEAIVTSGDYGRYFESDGNRFHHIIDPTTGYPSAGALAVTVLSSDPVLADAAATALMVAGPDEFLEVAAMLGVDNAAMIAADGELHLTPAMLERLDSGAVDTTANTDVAGQAGES